MLFRRDPAEPIGIWLDLQEDWRGLRVRGKLIPEVVRARELLALLREGIGRACRSASRPCRRASIRRRGCASCIRSISGKFPSSRFRCSRGARPCGEAGETDLSRCSRQRTRNLARETS